MRVAHRNAPDYRIYGPTRLLANFWQNGFLMTSPLDGESESPLKCGGRDGTRTRDLLRDRQAF